MINLLYSGNEKVFDGLLSSVCSIASKTTRPINLYFLTMDLSNQNSAYKPLTEKQIMFIEKVLQKSNSKSTAKLIDVTQLYNQYFANSANKNTHYTPYSYIRLLADLVDLPDKILYLDIDIMATKDISELYDLDISEYEYGAVLDHLGKIYIRYNYTNSGVMLINMKKIKQTKLFEKSRNLVINKKMLFPDQSAIYKSTTKKLILKRKFNEQRSIKKDTILKHFCKKINWLPLPRFVNVKQWDIYGVHKVLKINQLDEDLNQYIYLKKCFLNNMEEF